MDPTLLRTPLFDWRVAEWFADGRFRGLGNAGPISSIIAETYRPPATLSQSPIFPTWGGWGSKDLRAAVFLAELLTRRVADLALARSAIRSSRTDEGGILDDVLVGYYHDSYGQPFHMVVVNASNRQKIVDWIHAASAPQAAEIPGREVIFTDLSRLWAMFAIQGPQEPGGLAAAGEHRFAMDAILPRRSG